MFNPTPNQRPPLQIPMSERPGKCWSVDAERAKKRLEAAQQGVALRVSWRLRVDTFGLKPNWDILDSYDITNMSHMIHTIGNF